MAPIIDITCFIFVVCMPCFANHNATVDHFIDNTLPKYAKDKRSLELPNTFAGCEIMYMYPCPNLEGLSK